MLRSRAFLAILALPGALALAGCDRRDNSALDVAVVETSPSDEQAGALDDDTGVGTAQRMVRAATVEGLVAFDAEGRVVPALADRWIITDDGQSYIFRLRDGTWRNGDDLTAASARTALMAAIKAIRGTPLERDMAGIDEVRVMAGRVVEIRLERPMPYFLQLLAQPELGLMHDKQGAGPMVLEEAAPTSEAEPDAAGQAADESAKTELADSTTRRLVPLQPSLLGQTEVESWDERTRGINLHALSAEDAVKQFNAGNVDLVLGGRIQDFLLTRGVGILRGTIQLDPVVGLFGLQVMSDKGFLAEPANREALGMAIDREALIDSFGVGGWKPTTRVVSPGLEGDLDTIGERWSEQSLAERREVAAARVRGWMQANAQDTGEEALAGRQGDGAKVPEGQGETPPNSIGSAPELSIWLPAGDGTQILFARLSADLASVSIRLVREPERAKADLVLVDDVARYPRASWFLNRLSCSAKQGLCSPEADARVDEASKAATPEERAALLSEAEAELTAANVFIPFGTPIRWSLVRGSVNGFATNSWGWHPLMPLSWLPK